MSRFVADLAKSGRLLPASVPGLAYGRLGLWSGDGSVTSLEQLRRTPELSTCEANPANAPYGAAARELLESGGALGRSPGQGGVREKRAGSAPVAESGKRRRAITAWSLVFQRGGTLLPDSGHSPIRQLEA